MMTQIIAETWRKHTIIENSKKVQCVEVLLGSHGLLKSLFEIYLKLVSDLEQLGFA